MVQTLSNRGNEGRACHGCDPETEDSITMHLDRLTFSIPHLREELEPVYFDSPVRSFSFPLMYHFFGESPWNNPLCLRLRQHMPLLIRPAN